MSDKINFFIGSGASVAFGYPSMTNLTNEFRAVLARRATKQSTVFNPAFNSMDLTRYQPYVTLEQDSRLLKIYDDIVNVLSPFYSGKVDIESIMSVVIGLKEKNSVNQSIGDFGLYMIGRLKNHLGLSSGDYYHEDLNQLEESFKQYIREKMGLNPSKANLIQKAYDNFFGALESVLGRNIVSDMNTPYSKSQSTMHEKFNIFTTNYDTALEKYFSSQLKYTKYDTGAIDNFPEVNMDMFITRYYCRSNENRMKLLKLHGSVNWIMDNQGKILQLGLNDNFDKISQENIPGTIKNEVIIYPLSQKQLYITPFIQMFYHFEKELQAKKIWIIIGYSFRDIIIRNMFENSMGSIDRILLIDPNAESIKNSFDKSHNKIITINHEFGGTKNDETNKEIAKSLKQLLHPE